MDYAAMPNVPSTNAPSATLPPDPPDPPRPAPHPRRHTRYSAANTNLPPPHVVINTRRRRSPHHRAAPQTAVNASPPAAQGSSHISTLADSVPQMPPPNGQDHDRMETDEESEHYESDADDDDEPEDPEAPAQLPDGVDPAPNAEDVAMDITPDHAPAIVEGAQGTAVDQGSQTNPAVDGAALPGLLSMALPEGWILPPGSTLTVLQNAQGQLQLIVNDSMLDSGILRQELDQARRLEGQTDPTRATARDRQENARQQSRREDHGDDDDEGTDSDESMDEADHPYWAHFKPDTSAPDEIEMAAIEEGDEHSGTDHEYWEKTTFEPLDDPEYVPSDVGRISWSVEANHGTPEKPNREEIMRSPSVLIGGLYWNIKYYPRGNDGTDYMSVYIECSPKPYEEKAKVMEPASDDGIEEKILVEEAITVAEPATSINTPVPETATEQLNTDPPPEVQEMDMDASLVLPPKDTKAVEEHEVEQEAPWSVAAQVSCVVYNPAEPRTFAHQKSKHQYYNDNPDWGWTRFHGPWSDIHTRRRYQRKPLLENDTLIFTVYIQVIQDMTKSLWWHPSESQPSWDSMSLLGLRGLKCKEHHSSAMVAAISTWMHLGQLVESLCTIKVPSGFTKAGELLMPALKEFQNILFKEGLQSDSADISLSTLSQIVSFFYGTELDSRMDVVMLWDAIRRVLNLEATLGRNDAVGENKIDLFSNIAMLMQPDPFNPVSTTDSSPKFPEKPHMISEPLTTEPASVQEVIQSAFQHPEKAFRLWDHLTAMGDMPAVLQIELHRQEYNKEARKWKKLTHKIALDETVTCNDQQYTLYGMIVHCGGLDYHEYYSVLRPEGPGTRWLKYAGETSRSVEVLTTQQAVSEHEGGDSEKESAAVAYVAIYVRSNMVSQMLSSSLRKEILRKAEAGKEVPAKSDSDSKQEKMPKATPFRVGKRDWCAAFEVDEIYDAIGGAGHLSRAFYRTEGPNSTLRQTLSSEEQAKEEPENVEAPKQECDVPTDESKPADDLQNSVPAEPPAPKVTVFVKEFYTDQQRFVNRGTLRANGATTIVPFLREQLKIGQDETWDFYHEHTIQIKTKHLIKRSSMFFDLSHGDNAWDGIVIIAQRRPTAKATELLEAEGKCVTPVDYSVYLLGDHNPIHYAKHLTSSHFTHPYLSVPVSYGRPHGQGTLITLSGSAYTGPYRCGRKAGPNGVMHYANGDTYTGDWDLDEPNGQGTMIYAKTGNVYTGGWKKKLRYGGGVMKYKVADQEQMLCGVCYEKNMDAVFCFCGHMVACEECARKLETCPVCREPVKRVILLKGTTGGSGTLHEWAGGKEGGGDVGMIQ